MVCEKKNIYIYIYLQQLMLLSNNIILCFFVFISRWLHLNVLRNNDFVYWSWLIVVENKFFTPHGFISLATRTTSTLSWIFGKFFLEPKRAHIHTKRRQSPWFKLMAHHPIFWLMIQAHEYYQGSFGSCGLEGQEVCSVKL